MIALLAATLLLTTPVAAGPPPCRFVGEARDWTGEALRAWDRLDATRLRIVSPATPTMVLFDRSCAYVLTPSARGDFTINQRRYRTRAVAHRGRIDLPGGETMRVGRVAFASPLSDGGVFFTMALPSIWRDEPVDARDPRLMAMMVFMHEFAHTQQSDGLGGRVQSLLARGLPADATDDVVQDRFGDRPGYRAAYEAERDLFYASATAPDTASARAGLRTAMRRLSERRARWFTGDDAVYAPADDLFLSLEGVGQWAAWTWLNDPRGGRLSSADATAFARGGGNLWSQDEGLAIMLAIDRLTPDWPQLAFGPRAATVDALAARAVQPKSSE